MILSERAAKIKKINYRFQVIRIVSNNFLINMYYYLINILILDYI